MGEPNHYGNDDTISERPGLKTGQNLEIRAAHPHREFPRVPHRAFTP